MLEPAVYFSLQDETVCAIFSGVARVWEVLGRLPAIQARLVGDRRIIQGDVAPQAHLCDGPVFIGKGARIEPGAYIETGSYIGEGVTVRHGAYVRANCVLLRGSVLGHASEAKNSILCPRAQAPHFAYVGDSILGSGVNLGAGTKLSNLPILSRTGTVRIQADDRVIDTGLRKFGAVLGDDVKIGCNAVLNPGTLVGPRSAIYAATNLPAGVYPADIVLKLRQSFEIDDLEHR